MHANRSTWRSGPRGGRGFISVGAACQQRESLTQATVPSGFLRSVAASPSNSFPPAPAFCPTRGIAFSVLCRADSGTGRMHSSLRSHRPWRAHCRHARSGLNKTLYASAGPYSRGRGHRGATTGTATGSLLVREDGCSAGRMKPCRGHRHDGTPQPHSFAAGRASL
jgi:hypothetical protein